MKTNSELLRAYSKKNHYLVHGWLNDDSIAHILRIHQTQEKLGIEGHVGEIGVHHGRLFILLYLITREEENAVAVDIFDSQELNIDRSGHGDFSIFLQNLETYAGNSSKLKVIKKNSTTINGNDITNVAGGSLRFFSIDGGHLASIVMHDLETASQSICNGGVIILDDYFNLEFPGVSEGTNHFFFHNKNTNLGKHARNPTSLLVG